MKNYKNVNMKNFNNKILSWKEIIENNNKKLAEIDSKNKFIRWIYSGEYNRISKINADLIRIISKDIYQNIFELEN